MPVSIPPPTNAEEPLAAWRAYLKVLETLPTDIPGLEVWIHEVRALTAARGQGAETKT